MKHFITFSGLDGSGKSEQIRMLSQTLKKFGIKHTILYSRIGRTPSISIVRCIWGWALQKVDKQKQRKRTEHIRSFIISTFVQLSIWDTLLHYAILYRIKSIGCKVILCDRYILDNYIDLITLHHFCNPDNMFSWNLLEKLSPSPAKSFLLKISAQQANERELQREYVFVEPFEMTEYREHLYNDLAQKGKWDIVLDGNNKRHIIQEYVAIEVASLLC